MTSFWLSFCDDHDHLGACVVEAKDAKAAVLKTRRLGINPGGDVLVVELPPDDNLPTMPRDRLFQGPQLKEMGLGRKMTEEEWKTL